MKKLTLKTQTIRILTASDLTLAVGGQIQTSKQAGCTDDSGKTIVRSARC